LKRALLEHAKIVRQHGHLLVEYAGETYIDSVRTELNVITAEVEMLRQIIGDFENNKDYLKRMEEE